MEVQREQRKQDAEVENEPNQSILHFLGYIEAKKIKMNVLSIYKWHYFINIYPYQV